MFPKKIEFPLFYEYSLGLQTWLEENIGLSKYGKDNLYIRYMTPARAFAKYIFPTVNGQPDRPIITLHLNNFEYLTNQNTLGYNNSLRWDSETQRYRKRPALLVYRLLYGLNIYTATQQDMDNVLYQIMSKMSKNQRVTKVINRHWAEFYCGDPRDETTLEPGEFQDKIIRFGIDINVLRAYLPQSTISDYSVRPIETINVETEHLLNPTLIGDSILVEDPTVQR